MSSELSDKQIQDVARLWVPGYFPENLDTFGAEVQQQVDRLRNGVAAAVRKVPFNASYCDGNKPSLLAEEAFLKYVGEGLPTDFLQALDDLEARIASNAEVRSAVETTIARCRALAEGAPKAMDLLKELCIEWKLGQAS